MLRILLDAHVSSRAIARALRRDGHDVRAISEDPALEGLTDVEVLGLAAREDRIVVTHDVKDFMPLVRAWAEAGRSHGGCIVVHGIRHDEFGRLLRGLRRLFRARPSQREWRDLVLVLSPSATE